MITTSSNIDSLIDPLRFHYGDYEGNQYSEAVYRTALVNSIKYLSKRWNAKYYIDGDNNVARSNTFPFTISSPPIILPEDEYAIVLAATVIMRTMRLTSSASSLGNWQTPDLSVSNSAQERVYVKMYEQAIKDLDDYFSKGLAKSIKRFMLVTGSNTYPISPGQTDTTPGAVEST